MIKSDNDTTGYTDVLFEEFQEEIEDLELHEWIRRWMYTKRMPLKVKVQMAKVLHRYEQNFQNLSDIAKIGEENGKAPKADLKKAK